MSTVTKQIEDLLAENDDLDEANRTVFNKKTGFTLKSIGVLLESLNEHFDDMAKISANTKYYDENLTANIQSTIKELSTAFSQIKAPDIKVTPNINVDLKPLQSIADKLTESNGTIISLLQKMASSGNDNLNKLLTVYIEKQTTYFEKEIQQLDFSGIEKAINNRPKEFISKVTKYDGQTNRIQEITTKITK